MDTVSLICGFRISAFHIYSILSARRQLFSANSVHLCPCIFSAVTTEMHASIHFSSFINKISAVFSFGIFNCIFFGLGCVLLCHVVNPPLLRWLMGIGPQYTVPIASFLFGLYIMDNVLSIRSAFQLSHRLDDLQKVRQEIRSHLEEKAAQLQQKYEGRLEEVTDRFMAGLEDANDDFLKEKKLYLAQLRSGEDLFERRLLRSHPDLRSKRHSRKLLNLLREKRPGQKDKK